MTARRESHDVELAVLCQSCGLCCDGSLFGRARLTSSEVASAGRLHLLVVANGSSFALPCTALAAHTAKRHCKIYADRPEACRQFVCELYARHEQRRGSLDDGLAVVRRAKALLAFLDSAGLDSEESNPRMEAWTPVVLELTEVLEFHFARAITRGEPAEDRERPASTPRPQVAACRVSRPKVPRRRRSLEGRDAGFRAHVERIERGVGRPLAPPLEPPGNGGNRRGSEKHRRQQRGTSFDQIELFGPTG